MSVQYFVAGPCHRASFQVLVEWNRLNLSTFNKKVDKYQTNVENSVPSKGGDVGDIYLYISPHQIFFPQLIIVYNFLILQFILSLYQHFFHYFIN